MKSQCKELNEIINISKPQVILIGARPAMGKTSFVLNVITNIGLVQKIPTLFFSIEESKERIFKRILFKIANTNTSKSRSYHFKEEEYKLLENAYQEILKSQIYIEDKFPNHIEDIEKTIRKTKNEKNIKLVVIESLQLLVRYGKGVFNRCRKDEIINIGKKLKLLAKELNITILLTTNLSRRIEYRTNHRPILSDLGKITALADFVDVVMFLYRDDFYNTELDNPKKEIIIAKNQNGITKTIEWS